MIYNPPWYSHCHSKVNGQNWEHWFIIHIEYSILNLQDSRHISPSIHNDFFFILSINLCIYITDFQHWVSFFYIIFFLKLWLNIICTGIPNGIQNVHIKVDVTRMKNDTSRIYRDCNCHTMISNLALLVLLIFFSFTFFVSVLCVIYPFELSLNTSCNMNLFGIWWGEKQRMKFRHRTTVECSNYG